MKINPYDTISKHKTRLLARRFLNTYGIDYNEVFAFVARFEIIRLVVEITSSRNFPVYHLDVKAPVLNGLLEEMFFITQPLDFEVKGKNTWYRKFSRLSLPFIYLRMKI